MKKQYRMKTCLQLQNDGCAGDSFLGTLDFRYEAARMADSPCVHFAQPGSSDLRLPLFLLPVQDHVQSAES